MRNENPTVYSTEKGRICSKCGKPADQCICKSRIHARGDGIVRIQRESKGRNGKTVTVIRGVPLEGEALRLLAGELKRHCGTGGTLKDGLIEIQGDHRDMLYDALVKKGFRVKMAGG